MSDEWLFASYATDQILEIQAVLLLCSRNCESCAKSPGFMSSCVLCVVWLQCLRDSTPSPLIAMKWLLDWHLILAEPATGLNS